MDDKYMVYIFSVFLARGYPKAVEKLVSVINYSLKEALVTRFFRFLLSKIYDHDRYLSVQESINSAIRGYLRSLVGEKRSTSNIHIGAEKEILDGPWFNKNESVSHNDSIFLFKLYVISLVSFQKAGILGTSKCPVEYEFVETIEEMVEGKRYNANQSMQRESKPLRLHRSRENESGKHF